MTTLPLVPADPVHYCLHCGALLVRKRAASGRLEDAQQFRGRRYCSPECVHLAKKPAPLPCKVDGCDRPRVTRGFCPKHYHRVQRRQPLTDPPLTAWQAAIPDAVPDNLRRAVVEGENGCWQWTRSVNWDGYGQCDKGRAHKVFYVLLVEPVPSGLELDHLCSNRRCVNPEHLEPVTHAENVRRGAGTYLLKTGMCKKGHPMIPENIRHRNDGTIQCAECRRIQRAAAS